MLDIPAYRAAESAAKASLRSWRDLQIHRLDAFNKVGFPSRIESLGELGMLLDTMQEGRAASYREEMGQLSEREAPLLDQAKADWLTFAETFFPLSPIDRADDTLWSVLSIYRKLENAAPGFTRVLEIGPGCGYLSFILRHYPGLEHYAQVEACESFYLLQHLVNAWCFGGRAQDWALGIRRGKTISHHIPWWRLDLLEDQRFDVVTANACLLEMTRAALEKYLRLAASVLPSGAPFVAQCFGHPQSGNLKTLTDAFETAGFRVHSMLPPEEGRRTWNGVWERL